jgi:hypothetical protein
MVHAPGGKAFRSTLFRRVPMVARPTPHDGSMLDYGPVLVARPATPLPRLGRLCLIIEQRKT